MSSKKPPTELQTVVLSLSPFYWRAFGFALIGALLMLVPVVGLLVSDAAELLQHSDKRLTERHYGGVRKLKPVA
mgnify:CR=1 FL=1